MQTFLTRRKNIQNSLKKNEALLLPSLPEFFRQPDVTYPYRQDSCLYYVTGFEEPESFLILTKSKALLFVREKNELKELWDGFRIGSEQALKTFKVDESYPISLLETKLTEKLKGIDKIFYNEIHLDFDKKVLALNRNTASARDFLGLFRCLKEEKEIQLLTRACEVTGYAHQRLAQALRPNVTERTLHGVFIQAFMEKNSIREGYQSIIATGNNATTIHYIENSGTCKEGELLLVDAGAEVKNYTADVTRVYPVSGKFSKEQKTLYNKLLKLQKSLIEQVHPDTSLKDLQEKMQTGITEILLSVDILKGTLRDNLENKSFNKYCPHSIGHFLGLDVHDTPLPNNPKSILKPSMVITIEPGIYIPKTDLSAPKALRGVGLRIEDNILVTSEGYKNLTQSIPKEVEEIESLCS